MFSTNFEKVMIEKGIKPYRISKETGIPQSTLSDYKLGIAKPTIDKLELIASCLDVSVDYLLGRTNMTNTINGSVSGGAVIQGINNGHVSAVDDLNEPSKEELELQRIFKNLDVKGRHKLMALAFELEGG